MFLQIESRDHNIIIIFFILQNTKILVSLKRQFDPGQLLLKNLGLTMTLLEDRECQYLLNQEDNNRKIEVIDISIENLLIRPQCFLPNRILYKNFKAYLQVYDIFNSPL